MAVLSASGPDADADDSYTGNNCKGPAPSDGAAAADARAGQWAVANAAANAAAAPVAAAAAGAAPAADPAQVLFDVNDSTTWDQETWSLLDFSKITFPQDLEIWPMDRPKAFTYHESSSLTEALQ